MMDKENTGDTAVPGDVFEEDSFNLTTKLISNIYETGQWHKYITKVAMTALNKEPEETKFTDCSTISLSTHTAEREETILKTRYEKEG